MHRVGLPERVMLVLMGALIVVIGAAIGLDQLAELYRGKPMRAPRAVHAAGLIAIMRNAGPDLRQAVLRSGSNEQLRLTIVEGEPAPSSDDIPAPRLLRSLKRFVVPPIEGLQVYTNATVGHPWIGAPYGTEGRLAKVLMPLAGGRTFVIDWVDPPSIVHLTLLHLPPSAWAGVLGFAVAALALGVVFRAIRPLRRLTEAVVTFEGEAPRQPPVAEGAPDMQRLALAVHRMQERVAALLAERSFLIGAISHDLRTYLTRLRLRTETIDDPEWRGRMIGDLDAMTDLIDTSLAFARETTSSDRRRAVDLGDLVAVEVEERKALGATPTFVGAYEDGAVVQGDPVALRRVVGNILDNARKFARTSVWVRVNRQGERWCITIADDGPGIAEADREIVFDPFFRLERSRSRDTGGTGLGLAIARQIVVAHGGTIKVAATHAEGAVFIIILPASSTPAFAGAERHADDNGLLDVRRSEMRAEHES